MESDFEKSRMAGDVSPAEIAQQTLKEFHEVHARRIDSPPAEVTEELIKEEREALYRHAEAVRLHAMRLARRGK